MITLFDRASMERALTLDIDAKLQALLKARIDALVTAEHDLTECTEIVIVEPGDRERDLIQQLGFSPLVEPIDGARFGASGFRPNWDWQAAHGGWIELVESIGGGYAYIIFFQDAQGVDPQLLARCRRYAGKPTCA